ncbi:hypothetical protein RRG08_042986 [Elysia crispata]|uniref:Uncharacterized protein n=1 Tax=Elysia crispata TaxID=231223 RepID=A0AAE0XXU4_9GAST|nr:hypothetical protein RRG08_042986 [Elysia crispata]
MDVFRLVVVPLTYFMQLIESCLFTLVRWYDEYMYSPLQTALWPVVAALPRSLTVDGRTFDVFTANIVSWARTLLVIPIALYLKYQLYWWGFACVIFHDFLDHLDGIVAKVQRQKYGQVDDPIVGGFMDAFCDKIVNVFSLWSVLMVTDFSQMSAAQICLYIGACSIIIAYEFALGIVRVQDFFRAYYYREFKKTDEMSTKTSTAAVMEGKLKEKLESMGIAALCVAQSNIVPLESVSGILGVSCLLLSVRLAHSSLMSKLEAREPLLRSHEHASDDEDEIKTRNRTSTDSLSELKNFTKDRQAQINRSDSRDSAINPITLDSTLQRS